jgi:EpsG family
MRSTRSVATEQPRPTAGRLRPLGLLASALTLAALALAAQTLLAWFALAGIVTLLTTRGRLAWWPAVATVLMLAVLNSLKWPESDLAEYFAVLDGARQLPLWTLLHDESALLSIRSTEPVFRALVWLLARADPLPRVAFSLLGGLAIYGALLWLCRLTSVPRSEPDPAWQAVMAVTIALLAGVTFSLVGHLVRQYLAGGVFFIGLFGWAFTSRWRWFLWPAVACAIHNSALLLVLPLLLSLLLANRPRLFAIAMLLVLGASLTGWIPFIGELADAASFLKEDGEIGLALPLLDGVVLLTAWRVWQGLPTQERPEVRTATRLLCFGMALAVVLFYIRDLPLLFFRSYFYLEFLRVPMLAFIIAAGLRSANRAAVPAAAAMLTMAVLLCWLRARGTDWSYGVEHARWPVWMDVHSVMQRWKTIQAAPL